MTIGMTRSGSTLGPVPPRDTGPPTPYSSSVVHRAYPFATWTALIGIVVPTEVQLNIGAKFTPGRVCILSLLFPALVVLFRRRGGLLLSDFFAFAASAWALGAALYTDGLDSLSSTGAEVLEFCGAYVVARAFFWGPSALTEFIRVLMILAMVSVILGLADSISGRLVVHDTVSAIVNASPPGASYRENMVRASSTFDHPILFGTFCSVVATIILYSQTSALKRILGVSVCCMGCILSVSSAALMCFWIGIATYLYGCFMRRFPWGWTPLWAGVVALIIGLNVLANHPMGWIITHLTLDSQTGYYRLLIWDAALARIQESPWIGFSFNLFNDEILDNSIDSVWLVYALRFGVPMIVLLFMTNVTALLSAKKTIPISRTDPFMDDMRLAFTTVLLIIMFAGLTVHYWHYLWIFWGLCIGIRASLRELSFETGASRTHRKDNRTLRSDRRQDVPHVLFREYRLSVPDLKCAPAPHGIFCNSFAQIGRL